MPVRIVIADDHRILRAGLKELLSSDSEIQVVGEATNGEETLNIARSLNPDVLLMDIGMPGNEKLEATRQVIESLPDIRVLILTMYEDSALLKECLRIGAHGYIIKRAAESELVDAIRAVHRGIIYIHPSLMPALIAKPSANDLKKSVGVDTLTAREIEILVLIAQGNTNRQIARELSISVRTVESHRSNLMDKLDLHSRVELVRYTQEHNLVRWNHND